LFAIFGGNKPVKIDEANAKKVDPKIFFSLERTFLAWMLAAIWVAGISIGVGSRSSRGGVEALYSLFFLGVAIAFIIYALVTCKYIITISMIDDRKKYQGNFSHMIFCFSLNIFLRSVFFPRRCQTVTDGC
jgi:uncharacterized membrane protein YidH (DUF202 family)